MNKQDLLKVQTCVLRVNIHCDGCKQKVKKILQKVEGVYSVAIDSEQGKVTVSGNADPAMMLKKLTKSGKHAELWGGNGHKGLPKDFQNQFNSQFMSMMQMGGKDGGKHKGGGGKDLMKGGSLPPQFKGFKDMKAPSKDQKSVKFDLRDDHGEDDEDDYSDEDYSDEGYTEDEDYSDYEGEGSEDEIDHKHPPPKMMPFMNGKANGPGQGHGQAMNGMNMMMMNDKMKGKGGGGNVADMNAMMMMLNEKKGAANVHGGGGGGKGNKNKQEDSEDDIDDESDFDMPVIKMGGKDGKKGDAKNKEGKGKHGGGGVMKSIGGLFGGGQKKSKGGGEFEKKSKGDHEHHQDHKHHGGNGGKTKGGSGGGGGNDGKMGKDHGFINNGHGKADGGKIHGSHGGFQNINVNQGGKGGGGGPKMGPISHMNMGHHAGPMGGNFQAVQGLPAQEGMNPGYYNPGMGQGNPYNHQQQQYMAMMMNQQQQQAGMHGGEMYHPMMYARPHPAVNYANGYVPPMPPPSHANPYSHMFSDENTEGCSIM